MARAERPKFICFVSPPQKRSFDARHAELRKYTEESQYNRQKSRFWACFEEFLTLRCSSGSQSATAPTLHTATPMDVIRFLFYREKGGRTTVHELSCPNLGASGPTDCSCPRRLAAKTVDSYVGMLQASFNSIGRRGSDNPCLSDDVKGWVKACRLEQERHRVPVRQARPVFSSDLRLLVCEIQFRLSQLPSNEPFFPLRFILLRDWAFFTTQWFSGDRAGDLGRAIAKEVTRLDDGSLLYNHTVGKTVREAGGQLFVVPRIPEDLSLCPVEAFDRYVSACRGASVDLLKGYLFPPTAPPHHLSIRDAPFVSNAATKRLREYLPDGDFTAHGSRAGCAITLLMLGATKESVMEHCRWATEQVCRHYTKLERVRRLDTSARLLQDAVASSGGVSDADSAAFLYTILDSGLTQSPAIM